MIGIKVKFKSVGAVVITIEEARMLLKSLKDVFENPTDEPPINRWKPTIVSSSGPTREEG